MGFIIFILLIAVPIAEISLFINVGDMIGLWPTIAIVILTAMLGTALLRQQGLQTLARVQNALQEGRVPARELYDGICILVAGALLLTPGFLTDTIGFILMIPPLRLIIGLFLVKHLASRTNFQFSSNFSSTSSTAQPQAEDPVYRQPPSSELGDGVVIEADFEDIAAKPSNPDSPWQNSTK